MKKIGATPAKLALVGVLVVVFLAVVVPQLRGTAPVVPPQTTAANQSVDTTIDKRPATNTIQTKAAENQEVIAARDWIKLPFEQIVSNDPMAAPPWFVAIIAAQNRNLENTNNEGLTLALDDLEEQGASIIVITDNESVATIDGQQVRIGDRIEGFRVSDITTEGVVLTELHSN